MNTEATISFTLKSMLKVNPVGLLIAFIIITIIVFGLGNKIIEYYNHQLIESMKSTYHLYSYHDDLNLYYNIA